MSEDSVPPPATSKSSHLSVATPSASPVMSEGSSLSVATPSTPPVAVITPIASSSETTCRSDFCISPSVNKSSGTAQKISPVSKFLTPLRPGVTRRHGGARILTSAECLQKLELKKRVL